MAREIDDKKKRKALRKLRKAAERAEAEGGPGLSDWEREFVEEVEARVEKYGSAFKDPDKGKLDEPLSALQSHKLKEIDKKSRGKGGKLKRSSFRNSATKKASSKGFTPRSRDIHDDVEPDVDVLSPTPPPRGETPRLVVSDPADASPAPPKDAVKPERPTGRPKLRIVRSNEDEA